MHHIYDRATVRQIERIIATCNQLLVQEVTVQQKVKPESKSLKGGYRA